MSIDGRGDWPPGAQKPCRTGLFVLRRCENEGRPRRRVNVNRDLTRSSESTREGLLMESTQGDNDQPSRLTINEMAHYLAGVIYGNQSGYQQALDDMAAQWARAAHIVHAMAKLEPWTAHELARKARQEAACEANQAAAKPWPDEVAP